MDVEAVLMDSVDQNSILNSIFYNCGSKVLDKFSRIVYNTYN